MDEPLTSEGIRDACWMLLLLQQLLLVVLVMALMSVASSFAGRQRASVSVACVRRSL